MSEARGLDQKAHQLNILCAGECMLELRSQEEQFASGFAGDVVNFAIYLKRLLPRSRVQFMSAVGSDHISDKMRQYLAGEEIDTTLVFSSPEKTIGLYMIDTDASGERSFSYWRSDSAAKNMLLLANQKELKAVAAGIQYFYFSGITLAILEHDNRERLLQMAHEWRAEGKKIIFDPNYRASLWPSLEHARTQIHRAYEVSDMLLTSREDEQLLFGTANKEACIERLHQCSIEEVVMTDGAESATTLINGRSFSVTPAQAERVVDTTAAGDSFKAAYLAARHTGDTPVVALAKASELSSIVVGYSGAIIPKNAMPQVS